MNRLKCIGCGECRKVCDKPDDFLMLSRSECSLCGDCISVCPTGARHFTTSYYTPEQLCREAMEDAIFYRTSGGVTLSGGECMLQIKFLEETLALCKENGLHCTVDTCGAVPWNHFERIIPFTDLFLYDVKLIDGKRHACYTGAGNEQILSNLCRLTQSRTDVIIRVPLIPGYTDQSCDIAALGDFIRKHLDNKILRVELLPYNQLAETKYTPQTIYTNEEVCRYTLPGLKTQSKEYIKQLSDILSDQHIPVFSESL